MSALLLKDAIVNYTPRLDKPEPYCVLLDNGGIIIKDGVDFVYIASDRIQSLTFSDFGTLSRKVKW